LAGKARGPTVDVVGTAAITLLFMPLAVLFLALIGVLQHQVSELRTSRKLARLRRLPVLPSDVLRRVRPYGAVVAVEVRTSPEVIRAPESGRDCGWYQVKVTEHAESPVGEPVTGTLYAGPSAIRADDENGTVFIAPKLGRRRLVWRSPRLVNTSASSYSEARRERQFDGSRILGYSSRERIAPADMPVFVIGAVAAAEDGSIRLDRARGWTGTFIGELADLRQLFADRPDRAARRAHRLVIACWVTFGTCAVGLLGLAGLNYLLTH
jgi:hypothetical protein